MVVSVYVSKSLLHKQRVIFLQTHTGTLVQLCCNFDMWHKSINPVFLYGCET